MSNCKICEKDFNRLSTHVRWSHNILGLEYVKLYENIDCVKLYENGFSAAQIAKNIRNLKIGISPFKKDVLIFLKQNNVKIRSTSEAIEKWSEKRNGPWNKGLTKFDHPSILSYAESRRGENNPVHKIKDKEKWLENCRKAFKNATKLQYTTSSLEVIIKQILLRLEIKFEEQFNIKNFFYDFYIPEFNLVVEVNGTYWHCDPRFYDENFYNKSNERTAKEIWKRDQIKKMVAENNGYNLLYIWETEIKRKTLGELELYVFESIKNSKNRKNKDR